ISYLRPHLGPAMPKEQRTLPGKVSVLTAAKISLPMSLMIGLVMLMAGSGVAIVATPIAFVVLFGLMARGGMLTTEVLVSIVPILVLIIGVLFSIFQGIATPSESGSVGVLGALLLAGLNWYVDKLLVKDGADHAVLEWRLTPKALKEAGTSTLNIVVLVMTLLVSSTFFSQMFFQLGGSDQTSEWLTAVGGGKYGFVAVAMVAVFILGINLEFLEITFIVVPIFVPAMEAMGFSSVEKIWFAVLMAVNLNMAFISPPVGFSLFYLQSVKPPEVSTADIHKGALPFMVLQGIAIVIFAVFPGITEFSYRFFSGA
ncbi:MAG TPA: TRAP transporter large permease subunit, partial [Acidimicrobiales bacterium]|nr:TRAP transporter large permease subunit [Acidimicrobiales bacterium]